MSTDQPYVPSDAEMADAWWTLRKREEPDHFSEPPEVYLEEFDRFLARVRRDAKAEGWQEGVNFALPNAETTWYPQHNPYRREAS